MREILSHKVVGNEANEVQIEVVDEPGSGGANHHYLVTNCVHVNDEPYYQHLVEIKFQKGPIPANGINGVTQEVLLAIVADRLECFQAGPFHCRENELALNHVILALNTLKSRTEDRIQRQVEGQLKA